MDKVYEDNNVCTYMDDRDREVLVFALNMFKDSILLHSKVIDIYNVLYSMMNVTIAEYAFILAIMSFTIVFITAVANVINMPKEITFAYLILFPLAITIMYEIQDRKRRRKIEKTTPNHEYIKALQKLLTNTATTPTTTITTKYKNKNLCTPDKELIKTAKTIQEIHQILSTTKTKETNQKTPTRTLRLGQFDRSCSG